MPRVLELYHDSFELIQGALTAGALESKATLSISHQVRSTNRCAPLCLFRSNSAAQCL